MTYESDIALEDIVYLITDPDQFPRMVTAIEFSSTGSIAYKLSFVTENSWHSRVEIDVDEDQFKKLGIEEKKEV